MPEPSSVNAPLKPKISLITAVYNNEAFIGTRTRISASARLPQYRTHHHRWRVHGPDLEILESNRDKIAKIISEPDEGIYDALNKGIKAASGKYIAFLHSDDIFEHASALSNLVQQIEFTNSEFSCSDVLIVEQDSEKIIRFYRSNFFREWLF